jgi:ABC-type cobalt transport system substrate-binding protein
MGVAIGLAVLLIAILIVVKVVLYKKHHECLHCGVDDMDDDDFMEFEDLLDDNGLALADTKDFV